MKRRREPTDSTGKEGRFKNRARRVLALAGKAALVLVVVLVVSVAVLWGVLQREDVRSRILAFALSRVSEQISGQVSAAGIQGDLLTGFRLENVKVRDGEETIFSADALDVRFWLPTLLGGRWLIHSMTLEHADADLVRESGGTWNWQRVLQSPSESPGSSPPSEPPAVSIRRIRVVRSAISVSARHSGGGAVPVVVIRNLDLDAGLFLGARIRLGLRNLSFREQQRGFVLKNARGRIGYEPAKKALLLEDLTAATAGSVMTVDGQIRFAGGDPSGELTVDSAAVDLAELARLTGNGVLSAGTVTGRVKISGSSAALSFEAEAGLGAARLAVQGKATGLDSARPLIELTGSVDGLDPAALPLQDNAAPAGALNADLSARFAAVAPFPDGEAMLRFRPSRLAGVEIGSGTVRAGLAGEDLRFEARGLETGFGRFTGHGTVSGLGPAKRPLSVAVELDAEALNPGRIFGDDRTNASLFATLQADGQISQAGSGLPDPASIQGRVRGVLAPSVLAGFRIDRGRFDLRWDGRNLGISALDIEAAGTSAAAAGEIDFQGRTADIDVKAETGDAGAVFGALQPLLPDLPSPGAVGGAVSVRGQVKGSWARPRARGRLTGRGLRYGDRRIEEATVDAQWSGSLRAYRVEARFSADRLRLEGRDIQHLEGSVAVDPESMDVELDADLAGGRRVAAEGTVGPWKGPTRRVVVDRFVLSGGPFPVQSRGSIRMTVHPDRIEIERLALVSDPAELTISGIFRPERIDGVRLDFSLVALSRLRRLLPKTPAVEGVAEGSVSLSGALTAPKIEGRVRIEKAELDGVPLGDLAVAAASEAEQIRIDATLAGADGGRASVAGRVPVRLSLLPASVEWSAALFDLAFSAGNWRLSSIPFFEKTGIKAEGTARVSGTLGGSPAAPAAVADAVVSDGYFPAIDPSGERIGFSVLELKAVLRDGRGSVRAALNRGERDVAALSASAPVRFSLSPMILAPADEGLDARIVSEGLPVSAIPIPRRLGIEADGRMTLDLRATGAIADPVLHGTLVLEKGRLSLPRYGLSYEEVSARLKLDGRQVTVESLALSGDVEGRIGFSGRIELAGFRPARIHLEVSGDHLLIPYRRTLTARVRPALTVSGPAEAPTVSGELTILESRLNLDRLSDQGPAEIQVVGEVDTGADTVVIDPAAAGPSILAPLSADVRVILPKNSWMRGQGLNAEIGGEVGLRKAPGGPFTLTGSLSTLRGFYLFQGKRFTLEEGTVTFVGSEEPNPNLNIRASVRIRDVRITVQISGTARDIRLTLESDPAMDQAEIISYVVFGRSSEEMKTGSATSAEEAALKMTGALTASQLNEIFGDAFILDSLAVEPGEGGLGEGSVSMGKYVTEDVFVNYRQSFDLKQLHQLEVTYEILPTLDLETVIGDDKGYGIDLFWKKDY